MLSKSKTAQTEKKKFIIRWSCPECYTRGKVESHNEGAAIDFAFEEHKEAEENDCEHSFLLINSEVVKL